MKYRVPPADNCILFVHQVQAKLDFTGERLAFETYGSYHYQAWPTSTQLMELFRCCIYIWHNHIYFRRKYCVSPASRDSLKCHQALNYDTLNWWAVLAIYTVAAAELLKIMHCPSSTPLMGPSGAMSRVAIWSGGETTVQPTLVSNQVPSVQPTYVSQHPWAGSQSRTRRYNSITNLSVQSSVHCICIRRSVCPDERSGIARVSSSCWYPAGLLSEKPPHHDKVYSIRTVYL